MIPDSLTLARRDMCREVWPHIRRAPSPFAVFALRLLILFAGFVLGLAVARWRYDALQAAPSATAVPVLQFRGEMPYRAEPLPVRKEWLL